MYIYLFIYIYFYRPTYKSDIYSLGCILYYLISGMLFYVGWVDGWVDGGVDVDVDVK
jgi:serine/threonine protein kinase